jgi:hypothetical protein
MVIPTALAAAQQGRPNFNVERQEASTPEVSSQTPDQLQPGQTTTVAIYGKNFSPDLRDAHTDGQCKLAGVKYVSPTEILFTVTSDKVDDGGNCLLQMKMGNRWISNGLEIAITPLGRQHQQQREREERERQQREAIENQKRFEQRLAHQHDIVGKRWDVKLPNGKSDTWTLDSHTEARNQFKNSKGQEVMFVIVEDDDVVVWPVKGCAFTGKIQSGKVKSGESPLPECSLGNGAWSATIIK